MIQTYRVVRVLQGHSPVARIDGVNEDGLELRLEVPVEVAREVRPEQVLVVNWSVQSPAATEQKPEPSPPAATPQGAPVVIIDAEFTTSPRSATAAPPRTTSTGGIDPAAVDREFMTLMASRRGAREITSRDIDRELNTLLGAAGAKGPK